jgi:hypothetical protein
MTQVVRYTRKRFEAAGRRKDWVSHARWGVLLAKFDRKLAALEA